MERLTYQEARAAQLRRRGGAVKSLLYADFLSIVAYWTVRGHWIRFTDMRAAAPQFQKDSLRWWFPRFRSYGWIERQAARTYPLSGVKHIRVASGVAWRPEDHGRPKRDLCKWEYRMTAGGFETLDSIFADYESVFGRVPDYGELLITPAYEEPKRYDCRTWDGAYTRAPVAHGARGDQQDAGKA